MAGRLSAAAALASPRTAVPRSGAASPSPVMDASSCGAENGAAWTSPAGPPPSPRGLRDAAASARVRPAWSLSTSAATSSPTAEQASPLACVLAGCRRGRWPRRRWVGRRQAPGSARTEPRGGRGARSSTDAARDPDRARPRRCQPERSPLRKASWTRVPIEPPRAHRGRAPSRRPPGRPRRAREVAKSRSAAVRTVELTESAGARPHYFARGRRRAMLRFRWRAPCGAPARMAQPRPRRPRRWLGISTELDLAAGSGSRRADRLLTGSNRTAACRPIGA